MAQRNNENDMSCKKRHIKESYAQVVNFIILYNLFKLRCKLSVPWRIWLLSRMIISGNRVRNFGTPPQTHVYTHIHACTHVIMSMSSSCLSRLWIRYNDVLIIVGLYSFISSRICCILINQIAHCHLSVLWNVNISDFLYRFVCHVEMSNETNQNSIVRSNRYTVKHYNFQSGVNTSYKYTIAQSDLPTVCNALRIC